jgi:acetylornithine deacetylase/succinyl-diaminopimelate desuccinylase-like protein
VDLFPLTRQLIDLESITGNEARVGEFLHQQLAALGYSVQRMPVEADRFNIFANPPEQTAPAVVLSTHMDVVPPFIPSSEDSDNIYGRGACDAKGIIASQIFAAERLRKEKLYVGLLFLVGEERDSQGAKVANQHPPKHTHSEKRFLINGEPTENRIAIASKGSLRVELTAKGKMAHSAYPELGESAIEKLVHALERLLKMPLPHNPRIGPTTVNIGLIEGGRAPNVIPDFARAHLLYRLIGPSKELRKHIVTAVADLAEPDFVLDIPFVELETLDGLPTMVAAFTTDIPALTHWGKPVLIGPGSIHVAHTEREFVSKRDLQDAIDIYCSIVRKLVAN